MDVLLYLSVQRGKPEKQNRPGDNYNAVKGRSHLCFVPDSSILLFVCGCRGFRGWDDICNILVWRICRLHAKHHKHPREPKSNAHLFVNGVTAQLRLLPAFPPNSLTILSISPSSSPNLISFHTPKLPHLKVVPVPQVRILPHELRYQGGRWIVVGVDVCNGLDGC